MAKKKLVGIISIAGSLCVLIASSVLLATILMSSKCVSQDCDSGKKNTGQTKSESFVSKPSVGMRKGSSHKSNDVPLESGKSPKSNSKNESTVTMVNTTTTTKPPSHPLRVLFRRKRSTSDLKRQQQPQLHKNSRHEYPIFMFLTISTIILSIVKMMAGLVSLCPPIQASQTCVILWTFLNALLILFFVIILVTSFYYADPLKTELNTEFWTFICVMFGDLLILIVATFILARHSDVSSSQYEA